MFIWRKSFKYKLIFWKPHKNFKVFFPDSRKMYALLYSMEKYIPSTCLGHMIQSLCLTLYNCCVAGSYYNSSGAWRNQEQLKNTSFQSNEGETQQNQCVPFWTWEVEH